MYFEAIIALYFLKSFFIRHVCIDGYHLRSLQKSASQLIKYVRDSSITDFHIFNFHETNYWYKALKLVQVFHLIDLL